MNQKFLKAIALVSAIAFTSIAAISCGTRSNAGETVDSAENVAVVETAQSQIVSNTPSPTQEQNPEPQATEAALEVSGELEEAPPAEQAEAQESTINLNLFPTGDNFMKPHSIEGIDIDSKVIALTMDDGPSKNTPAVLDILKEEGVKATFFVIGDNVKGREETLKRTYDEGHEIGNHSWSHAYFTKISFDSVMKDELGKTNDAIEAAVGKRTIMDRPPGGYMTTELASKIQRPQIMWSSDTEDWKNKDVNISVENAMKFAKDGGVILWHDLHSTAPEITKELIKRLKADGYQFVTVSQMMQIAKERGDDVGYFFYNAPTAGELDANAESGSDEAENNTQSEESTEAA